MTRYQMILLLLVALLASPTLAQLSLLAPALPSPSDVIKVIDVLTRKDTNTTMDVRFGKTTGQGKLLIARTRVDVTMKRTSRNWRGPVIVDMTVPSDVSYSVALSALKPEHIRLDGQSRRLTVVMPMPAVEDVTPLLPNVTVHNDYNRARFKFLDSDTTPRVAERHAARGLPLRGREKRQPSSGIAFAKRARS